MNHAESKLQAACVKWFRLQYPYTLIFAIPNGGARNAITGAVLKREGVIPGIPDLFVATGMLAYDFESDDEFEYRGLFIEMKAGKGRLTKTQEEVHKQLRNDNYCVRVCRSFEEFKETVEWYMG